MPNMTLIIIIISDVRCSMFISPHWDDVFFSEIFLFSVEFIDISWRSIPCGLVTVELFTKPLLV